MNRTTARSVAAAGCTVVLALTFTGCGSDSKDSGSKALSTSAFKSKANAICKAGSADIKTIGAGISATSTEADITTALNKSADRVDDEVSDIKKLAAPKGIADDVKSMLAAVSKATAAIKDHGIDLIKSGEDPFTDADTKAKALGLDDCVSSAS